MYDVRSPDEYETYEWASTTYQRTKEQNISKTHSAQEYAQSRLLQSYVEVIDDIAQDIGYIKGAQAEMIEPLLCRMAEHINVFGAKKVVFSKMTRVLMKRHGVSKRDIKRVSVKKVSE